MPRFSLRSAAYGAIAGILSASLGLAAGADAPALPDPCFDPARPGPAYCEVLVVEFVERADGQSFAYQLYAYYENLISGERRPPQWVFEYQPPYNQSAVKLFDAAGDLLFAGEWNVGDRWYETPRVVDNPDYGPLLVVPERWTGSGAFVDDKLFRFREGRWRRIAASPFADASAGQPGWIEGTLAKLPEDVGLWKGIPIDFRTMTATTPVWLGSDPNCCPTGGTADIAFAIEGDHLVVRTVTYRP